MKLFKSILLAAVAAFGLITPSFAASAAFDGTTTSAVSVVNNKSLLLTRLDFVNSATGTVSFAFFSAPTNVLTKVFSAYTNSTVTAQNTTVLTTNVLGNKQTNIYATVTTALGSVSAITNNYPKLYSYTVAGSSSVTVTLSPPIVFMTGLAVTNSATNCTFTATYIPGF